MLFYAVVNIWGILYASVDPRDHRLYNKKELPVNHIIIKERAPIYFTNKKK